MDKQKAMKLTGVLGSVLVGLVFIYSAFTKLYPIELFELAFVDAGVGNWTLAPVEARLFIGAEFLLGFLLVLNINPGNWIYKSVIILLLLLSAYLVVQILIYGNRGNCGCFGDALQMTPVEAIIKNIVLLAVVILLYLFHPGFAFNKQNLVIICLAVASLALPFMLNPLALGASSHFYKEETGYKLDLDLLYNSPKNKPPQVELRKGKWVLAYLSLSCGHCKMAARKLQIMKRNNPSLPIFFVLNGKPERMKPFFDETKSENVPHMVFKGKDFLKMSGPELPAIFLLDNSIVYQKPNYFTLDQSGIEEWYSKK